MSFLTPIHAFFYFSETVSAILEDQQKNSDFKSQILRILKYAFDLLESTYRNEICKKDVDQMQIESEFIDYFNSMISQTNIFSQLIH